MNAKLWVRLNLENPSWGLFRGVSNTNHRLTRRTHLISASVSLVQFCGICNGQKVVVTEN